jgi:hypothetical protein
VTGRVGGKPGLSITSVVCFMPPVVKTLIDNENIDLK